MLYVVMIADARPESVAEAARSVKQALDPFLESAMPLSQVVNALALGALATMPLNLPTHRWRADFSCGPYRSQSLSSLRVVARIGAGPASGPDAPGLEVTLTGWRDQELGPALRTSLGTAFAAAVRSGRFSRGWGGPAKWTHKQLNAWSFTPDAPRRKLPPGASCEPVGGGYLLSVDMLSALGLEQRVAELPSWFSVQPDVLPMATSDLALPEPALAETQSTQPASALLVPGWVLPTASPDETAPLPMGPLPKQVLPFAGSLSAEQVRARVESARPAPAYGSANPNPDETVMLPFPTATAASSDESFRGQLSPLAIPILSLDEYAQLRAQLNVFGEHHAPTLQRFGVADRDVLEALQRRFAQAFARDAKLQQQFVTKLAALVQQLRGTAL
jgi:hypothetical protein